MNELVKGHVLPCKRASFTLQKGVFYDGVSNLLNDSQLQNRFREESFAYSYDYGCLVVRIFLRLKLRLLNNKFQNLCSPLPLHFFQ